jgi:Methyltransferase domain
MLGRPRRWRFLELLPKGGIGAELGVYRGEFTSDLLRVTQPRELHLIDPWWTEFPETYPDWGDYSDHGRLTARQAYEETMARADERCVFHIGFDFDVLPRFPDGYFDWIYIDTSHRYEDTRRELELARPKMKPGGILSGHDWREDPSHPHHGVCRAVKEFCEDYGWRLHPPDLVFAQWAVFPPDHEAED